MIKTEILGLIDELRRVVEDTDGTEGVNDFDSSRVMDILALTAKISQRFFVWYTYKK